jgi:hypothetical protein
VGKRSKFKRRAADKYFTPERAVVPLFDYFRKSMVLKESVIHYDEPCAGDGRLIDHIAKLSNGNFVCDVAMDIEPDRGDILKGDALVDYDPKTSSADMIITNPPWTREILHPMIERFRAAKPTWLLFDADWMHTVQAAPYLEYCSCIISVGRVKWIDGSTNTGKDNSAWYLFDFYKTKTTFIGR